MAAESGIEREAVRWLRDDAELRRRDVWKAELHEKKKTDDAELGAVVYSYQAAGDSGKWFKIEGRVRTSVAEMRDLLDARLLERQKEWHHLFIEGAILEKRARPDCAAADALELCWMTYDSGTFLVSARDFVYWKVGQTTADNGDFQLSYRTVDGAGIALPKPSHAYVRGEFQAAHFVEDAGDGFVNYTYIQRANPKGLIPLALTHPAQADILLKEIRGVRQATRQS